MSLHFISGKPGGGKSLHAMQLLQEELIYGNRLICTNLPINLAELNEYLQREFPDTVIDLHTRLRLLDDQTETGQFWLYRWPSQQIASVPEEEWKQGKRYDFSKPVVDVGEHDRGVLFIIDEIHLFFNAREWMNTGKGCLFYLSQHRKLGDDVIAVTQSIGNVDKQFRSLAQDFSYIRNLKKERKGMFKLPGIFIRSTYAQPFTGQPGVEAMEVRTFKLQPTKLAACYNTAAGVGVLGRSGADRQERVKGLHWGFAIAAIVIAAAGVAMIPHLLGKLTSGTGKAVTKAAQQMQEQGGGVRTPPVAEKHVHTNPSASETSRTNRNAAIQREVELVGYWMERGRLVVLLSDGTKRSSGIYALDENGVVVDGERYQWRKVLPAEPVPVSRDTQNVLTAEPSQGRRRTVRVSWPDGETTVHQSAVVE